MRAVFKPGKKHRSVGFILVTCQEQGEGEKSRGEIETHDSSPSSALISVDGELILALERGC